MAKNQKSKVQKPKLARPANNHNIKKFFTKTSAPTKPSTELPAEEPAPKRVTYSVATSALAFSRDEPYGTVETSAQSVPSPFTSSPSPALNATTPAVQIDAGTLKPFAKRDVYICPYKAKGRWCVRRNGGNFSSFKGLCQHTDKAHFGGKEVLTPVEECPLQDGTKKIPCPKKCGRMFTSYQQANHHSQLIAKNDAHNEKGCSMPNREDIPCPWKAVLVCNSPPAVDSCGYADHHRTHTHDLRGLYSCSKACGQYHVDLYMLQSHEENCKGPVAPKRKTTLRFKLGSASAGIAPSVIVVARASALAPKGWAAGTSSIEEGLPIWADQILRHYAAMCGEKFSSAVLHASAFVRTRYMPAPAQDNSTAEVNEDLRWHVRRAHFFTQAILADIKAANAIGVVPTILSVGLDAFTCNTKAIRAWLRENQGIDFTLVLRLNNLDYGITDEYLTLHSNVHWGSYRSDSIRTGDVSDKSLMELMGAWDKLQGIKDSRTGDNSLKHGRNGVDPEASFPDWD